MKVCHGIWIPSAGTFENRGQFAVWIESSTQLSDPSPTMHPCHIANSESLLDSFAAGLQMTNAKMAIWQPTEMRFTATLPTDKKRPLPSWEMAQLSGQYLPEKFQWNPWDIHGISIRQPLEFLKDLQYVNHYGHPEFHFAGDLVFWIQYAHQLRMLIRQHQFLPVMKCYQEKKRSPDVAVSTVWAPVAEMYEQSLAKFASAMPDACKTIQMDSAAKKKVVQPECLSGIDLLRHFSEVQINDLVSNTPFTLQILNRFNGTWLESAMQSKRTESNDKTKNVNELAIDQWKRWRIWCNDILGGTSNFEADQSSGFVLGFQLSQSDPFDENNWALSFFVSSRADPSLRIDLEDWWKLPNKESKRWIKHFGEKFERNLLVNLGHAARICPLLWQGMECEFPFGVTLDLQLAYEFLKNDASVLESAGFRILVPSWWTPKGRKRARIRINASGKSRSGQTPGANQGYFGLSSVIAYRYELSVGGEKVTESEWSDLINAKTPLVRFRGQWMELDSVQMSQMLELWHAHEYGTESSTVMDMLKHFAESDEDSTEFVFDEVLENVLNGLLRQEVSVAVNDPVSLNGQLRPYQKKGLAWLAAQESLGLNPCLADDMGLGKTIQIIALMLLERERAVSCGNSETGTFLPTLLIAPTSVLSNWQREIEKFAPSLKSMIHHGSARITKQSEFEAAACSNDIVITSFSLARRDKPLLNQQRWHRIVVDEAQNIKNPKSAQAKAVCSFEAPSRIALTGTPVENRLMDLWSLFHFLNPGYLGTSTQFRRAYEMPINRESSQTRLTQLQQLVRPFILRRMKTDRSIIDDLPDKLEQKIYCNLTMEQASLYQAVVDDVQTQIDEAEDMQRRGIILSTLMKLKQICNHPAQFLQDGSVFSETRSHKLARVNEMIQEALEESDSMLVFTQFTEVGSQLETLLRAKHSCPVYYLHGGTSRKRREQMIDRFQDPDTLPGIFVLSLRAGGVGITLTRANHVFHFDRWWNPAVENQATDRAFRIGQKKTVFAHKMVTLGTLEEKIDKMIEDKQSLANSIVGTDESWLTEMNDGEFRQLIELNRSTIMET